MYTVNASIRNGNQILLLILSEFRQIDIRKPMDFW